jgi:hypothetical protein
LHAALLHAHTDQTTPFPPPPFFSTRWAAFFEAEKTDGDVTSIILPDDPGDAGVAAPKKAEPLSGQAWEVLLTALILVLEMVKVLMKNKSLKGAGARTAANTRYRKCLGPSADGPVTADAEARTIFERAMFDSMEDGKANMSGIGTAALNKAWSHAPKVLTDAPMFIGINT